MSVYPVITNIVQPGLGEAATKIKLEQSQWLPCTGKLTRLALATFLRSMIYGEGGTPVLNCGFDGLGLSLTIFAYPFTPDLAYSMHSSRGILGERVTDEVEKEQIVKIRPGEPVSIDYPILRVLDADWQGNAYNKKMQQITHPSLVIGADEKSIETNFDVYAWVKLKYLTTRHSYQLRLEKREGAAENKFTAVVYAIYHGRPVWLEIDPPPGADEFEGNCGGGTTIDDHSPDGLPTPSGDRKVVVNYCARKIISDTVSGT